jgi:hypothetical protein
MALKPMGHLFQKKIIQSVGVRLARPLAGVQLRKYVFPSTLLTRFFSLSIHYYPFPVLRPSGLRRLHFRAVLTFLYL